MEPGRIGLRKPVTVIIRALRPGDPLDGQALFTRSLLFREASPDD